MQMKSHYRTTIAVGLCLAGIVSAACGLRYAAMRAAEAQADVKLVTSENVESLFEARYQAWREWIRQEVNPFRSDFDPRTFDNEPFRQIVELGVPAVPYIMDKVKQDSDIGYALYKITKFRLHEHCLVVRPGEVLWTVEEFPDIGQKGEPPDVRELLLRWWNEGRQQTPQRFEKLYNEWQDLAQRGEAEEATEKYQRIIDLGIVALPCIVKKIEEGQTDLVPAISVLTNGAISEQANPAACVEWWTKNKQKWTLPPVKSETVSSAP